MIERHDVIIVGAGPAGLAAGIYAGRARFKTLILEKGVPGGQILLTVWVENYPGFPDGIAPFDLIDGFRKLAERFGARSKPMRSRLGKETAFGISHGRGNTRYLRFSSPRFRLQELGLADEARLTGKACPSAPPATALFTERMAVVGGETMP